MGTPGSEPLSAPPAVSAYLALSADERAQSGALQQLYGVIQALSQGYNCPPETRRRLVEAVLATVPHIQPEATTASDHTLVPPTCALLKLLGRNPAGTEQLARPDGLRLLLRLGGLERIAETSDPEPALSKDVKGSARDDVLDPDDDEDWDSLATSALAAAKEDPLSCSESEALRCIANTLTLHPSARDVFPEVILADERRAALRGLVRLLTCKRAGFLSGRILFLLTSKPSEIIAELARGGECVDALQTFAEQFLTIYKSPLHRALLSAGPPTTTYADILKEHLKLAYNLMLQYSRAPPALPEPFAEDSLDDLGTGTAQKKKRFWRRKSSCSGTDQPSGSVGTNSPTQEVPPSSNVEGSSSPTSPGAERTRSSSPVRFAKRVVGAVKRASPTTSPKGSTSNLKRPNAGELSEGNGPNSLSLTAAHVFLPLFRPYLVLATTLPLLEPAPPSSASFPSSSESKKEVSPTVRAAHNTLLNFPLELEELSGWSNSWLQYIPPRISSTDGTVLRGGGFGSLGERLIEIVQAVCDLHFPADRVPPHPKLVTKQDREHGRALEAPCHPDEWLPSAGEEAQKVEEVLGPVVLLLRKLSMLSDAQVAFRELIFPDHIDRTLPLDRQSSLAGHLVRLMSSVLLPNTAFGVGEFIYNLCDRSAEKLVRTIGYGNASGFLQNRQELIPPPPPVEEDEAAETTATSRDGASAAAPLINPITGAYDQKRPEGPPLTEEEKEREAERLYTLFERMAHSGVISIENPVNRAKKEGKFEETTQEREAELERIRREEEELEQEVERDLKEWRASRSRSAATDA